MAIFGLFIGINDYPVASHRLKGCVADMTTFHDYIKVRAAQDGVDFEPQNAVVLKDKKATRADIIAGFDVFRAAKDGDTCVLYYSGHGSRARVPLHEGKPMFDETDSMTESLVAYDSRTPGGSDVLDKELGFLIYNATFGKKVHFLAVFDCCHAGGNTRNMFTAARARMAQPAQMPTDITQVLGYKEGFFTKNEKGFFQGKDENPYVALAASRSNQTAKEVEMPDKQTRGVFTYMLLEILQKQGTTLTYTDIVTQINLTIQNIVTDQNALVEASGESKLEFSPFLGGALRANETAPKIAFNKTKNEWQINQGSINGLAENAVLRLKQDKTVLLGLADLRADVGIIKPEQCEKWDKKAIFEAEIVDLGAPKILACFLPDADKKGQAMLKAALAENQLLDFALTDKPALATYHIGASQNTFTFLPFGEVQPIFKGVVSAAKTYDLAQAQIFVDYIERVLLHQKVCSLDNPRTTLPQDDIQLDVYKIDATVFGKNGENAAANVSTNKKTWTTGQKGEKVNDVTKPILVQYFNDAVIPTFRLNIKNTSAHNYFVGAVVAYADFRLSNNRLENKVVELEVGKDVWLKEGKAQLDTLLLPLFRKKDSSQTLNAFPEWITEVNIFVKIIISTESFSINKYEQNDLPIEPVNFHSASIETAKDISSDMFDEPTVDANWTVKTLHFVVQRRPIVQILSPNTLSQLQGISIISNSKISAKATLTTTTQGTRDIGAAQPDMRDKGLTPFNLNGGFAGMPGLNVLEFQGIDNETDLKSVTKKDPIILQLTEPLAANEVVIPMGYIETDAKDKHGNPIKWFYPIGGTLDANTIRLEHLPDPMTEGTRSFTGAIKVFFQKVVLQKTDIRELREVEIQPDPELLFKTFYKTHTPETLTARVKMAKNIVIFVHGIIGDTEIMVQTMKRISLENRYDLALAFDYESLDSHIPETAAAFQKALENIGINAKTAQNVHIIAHSMGGLVSRYMLEKGKNPPKIAHLIQVGTPNNGSPWGDFQAMVQFFLPRLINYGGGAVGLPPFVTKIIAYGAGVIFDKINNTLEDMQPDSPFMKKLNDGTDSKVPMTIIAGNTTLLIQEKAFFNRVFTPYFALNSTLFNDDNDMAVTVESIQTIKGGEKRAFPPKIIPMIPCDHVSYFLNETSLRVLREAVDGVFVGR
jgi:pimeloyl-ACP methyl ester carboxylesterase